MLANSVRHVNTGCIQRDAVISTGPGHVNLGCSSHESQHIRTLEEAQSEMAAKNTQGRLSRQPSAARVMFCLRLCANI